MPFSRKRLPHFKGGPVGGQVYCPPNWMPYNNRKRARSWSNKRPGKRARYGQYPTRDRVSKLTSNYGNYKKKELIAARNSQVTELKYNLNNSAGYATVSSSGTILNLTAGMQRGVEAAGRFIGNTVIPTSINTKWSWQYGPSGPTSADGTNIVRQLFIQWKGATTPTVADIFATASYTDSPPSFVNRDLLTVLSDDRDCFRSYWSGLLSWDVKNGTTYIKGKRMKSIAFGPTSGGTSPVVDGGLYLVLVTDSSAAPHPAYSFTSMLTYFEPQ